MLCLVNQVLIERVEFISLKQDASKEVFAQEFSDLPEIYSSITSRLDKAELEYHKAMERIEHTIEVVGETTAGLIVSDVL